MRHVKRAAVVAAVIWAYIVGYVSGTPAKPYCPTEDSCRLFHICYNRCHQMRNTIVCR